jgi:competence protein ComEC
MPVAPLAAFVIGVGLLQWQAELPTWSTLAAVAALGLAGAVASVRTTRSARSAIAMASVAAVLMGFSYAAGRAQLRLDDALPFADEGRDVVVTGVVASLPVRLERGVRFEFDIEQRQAGVVVPQRVLLGWYVPGEAVRPGERWKFVVRLRRPHGAMNPGGFDFEAWMIERNLRANGYVRTSPGSEPQRLQSMVWTPHTTVERARAWLRDRLLAHVRDERYGGVLVALVLGDQRAIADADWTLFNRTGIAHLVSISGLHITMIAALVGGFVGAVWRRMPALLHRAPAQTAAIVAAVFAAFLYALLAGWGVPAQRTVLMLTAVALAWLARRRVMPGAALAFAAAAVCLVDPWAVTAAGFWLSFGAVAAIVWVVHGRPPPDHVRLSVGALKTAARVQVAVTLALVPATVLLFQQVSLVAPLANAVAIPVVSWIVTPLALVGAGAAALPPPLEWLAAPLLAAAGAVFAAVAAILTALSSPGWAAVAVPAPPLIVVVLAVVGVAWLLAPPGWPARGLGAVALLPLFVWPAERPPSGALWITALDVGQGSAVVLETREQAWLYDAGPRYSPDSDAGERVVLPFLRSRGIAALDGVVVSHLDQDHSGGTASVLRGIEVRRLLSSIPARHANLGTAEAERCIAGQQIEAGGLRLRVLHPQAVDYGRRLPTNAMSCVVHAQLGGIGVLLTGDIPAREEADLIEREPGLRAAWLMVPHHGSRSSSSEVLLAAVRPAVAVAQAGYRNRFGHPDPQVLARYAAHGIALTRTDHAGAAQWRYRPDGAVEFRSWRAIAVRYWHNRPGAGHFTPALEAAEEVAEEVEPREPLFGMP